MLLLEATACPAELVYGQIHNSTRPGYAEINSWKAVFARDKFSRDTAVAAGHRNVLVLDVQYLHIAVLTYVLAYLKIHLCSKPWHHRTVSKNVSRINTHLHVTTIFFGQDPKLNNLIVFRDFSWGWNVGDVRIVLPAK